MVENRREGVGIVLDKRRSSGVLAIRLRLARWIIYRKRRNQDAIGVRYMHILEAENTTNAFA